MRDRGRIHLARVFWGSKESRPALNRVLADAKRSKFDAVLVYRYDRFARRLRQLVNALAEFDALGIHYVSLHEGVDSSTPNGRLVFGIFGSIAEFERELIRGRFKSGIAAARTRAFAWDDRASSLIVRKSPCCALRGCPGRRSRRTLEEQKAPGTGWLGHPPKSP